MYNFEKTDCFLINFLDETKKYRIYRDDELYYVKTSDFLGVISGQEFINIDCINTEHFFIGDKDGNV